MLSGCFPAAHLFYERLSVAHVTGVNYIALFNEFSFTVGLNSAKLGDQESPLEMKSHFAILCRSIHPDTIRSRNCLRDSAVLTPHIDRPQVSRPAKLRRHNSHDFAH
jgi:hypothetical protein